MQTNFSTLACAIYGVGETDSDGYDFEGYGMVNAHLRLRMVVIL